jgi:5-methylcytosine-specific restriction endonuclease McrA
MLSLVPSMKKCAGLCGRVLPFDSFGVQTRGLYGRKSECKTCLSEKEAARRAADPEAERAYKRAWWAKQDWTSEERAAASKRAGAWYASNKGRQSTRVKLYYVEHAEEIKAYVKEWQKANPEKVQTYLKRWRYENADVLRQVSQARAVLYAESDFTFNDWLSILDSFNHACAYCLRIDVKLTMDHVIAVSRGGEHTVENVIPACRSCNSRKYNRPIWVMVNQEIQVQDTGERHAG